MVAPGAATSQASSTGVGDDPSAVPGVAEDAQELLARQQRATRLILAHQLSTLSISLLTLQPRGQLLMNALSGDTALVATQINRGAALVALSDFLVSPSVGALSDRVGRKPFLLLAPAAALPLKLACLLRPTAPLLLLEKVISDSMRTLGGTSMAYVCFSDLFQGKEYTAALGQLNSATGLGIVGAPLLASALIAGSGSPRRAYAASAVLATVHLVLGCLLLEETLHLGPRVRAALPGRAAEITGQEGATAGGSSEQAPTAAAGAVAKSAQVEPILKPVWMFTRLFTENAKLRLRACLFTLHCMLEGKVLQDQVSILQLGMGWDTNWRSRWTSGLGLAILAGGQATKALVERCGEHWFTTLCHLSSLGAFLALRGASFWGALILFVLGQQRRSAVASWLIAESHRAGIGRGETIGYLASLRAVCEAVSSLAYGAVYRRAVVRGRSFDIFLLPAAVTLLSELQRVRVYRDSAVAATAA